MNSAEAVAALLDTATKNGITINRVTETYGMFRHTRDEIKEYCRLCHDYGAELLMSTGPRATYDTGATVLSPQGVRISYRLRGMEQVLRGVEDIKRGYDLGVRGFLIYDEGMLWLVGQMRKDGALPKDIIFKTSAHLGHCNPCSFKLLESLGADSINPVRDLQIPMIAALRAAVKVPLDVHTDNPPGSGGFIRVYEAPEIVRVAAPVHLQDRELGGQRSRRDDLGRGRQAHGGSGGHRRGDGHQVPARIQAIAQGIAATCAFLSV